MDTKDKRSGLFASDAEMRVRMHEDLELKASLEEIGITEDTENICAKFMALVLAGIFIALCKGQGVSS